MTETNRRSAPAGPGGMSHPDEAARGRVRQMCELGLALEDQCDALHMRLVEERKTAKAYAAARRDLEAAHYEIALRGERMETLEAELAALRATPLVRLSERLRGLAARLRRR